MEILAVIFYLLAAVCFGVAAFNAAATRVNLVAAGLLLWLLPTLIASIAKL